MPAETQPESGSAPEAPAPETEKPKAPEGPSLAEQIRAERAAREAKRAQSAAEKSATEKLAAYEKRLAEIEKSKDNALLDSVGFLERLGLSKGDMATFAENVMFTLVPDKAPPDFLPRLIKAQRARDEALMSEREQKKAQEAQEAAARAAQEEAERLELDYRESLAELASKASAETYPTSATWFGKDHEDYAESLLHTARNLATEATRQGRVADLRPETVAAALEKHLAARAARLKPQAAEPNPVSKPSPAPVKQSGPKDKIVNLPSDSAGLSESERIARAVKAAFPRG